MSQIKDRGAAQVHTVDGDVILLRKVDFKQLGPGLTDLLRNTDLRPGDKEGDRPWFPDGFVAANHPRDMDMSLALANNTLGYAIARVDTGDVLHEFAHDQLQRASRIAERAKAELAVDILIAEEEADEVSE
jgi:hypothetical protein